MRIGQVVITSDLKARELVKNPGHVLSQKTPHHFSWRIFQGRFGKSDRSIVIDQHRAMEHPLRNTLNGLTTWPCRVGLTPDSHRLDSSMSHRKSLNMLAHRVRAIFFYSSLIRVIDLFAASGINYIWYLHGKIT